MNRGAGKQYAWIPLRISRSLFIPRSDSFAMNPQKKTLMPYIYNASSKDPFYNSPRKDKKRKRRRSDPVLWQNPLYQQKIRKPKDNTHTYATKNFDYTTIADRLRTVSWSNK